MTAMRYAGLAVALLLLAACDPVCGGRTTGPAASSWHLTFTGPAAGTVSSGHSDCLVGASGKRLDYALSSLMNGTELIMTITIYSGFTGKGTYKVGTTLDGAAEVRLDVDHYQGSSASGAGTVTVNSDSRSGTVDANLPNGEHVKGSWKCDKYESSGG
jgi:hypothetical protein